MLDQLSKLHWCLSVRRRYPGFTGVFRDLQRETLLDHDSWQQLRLQRLRQLLVHAHRSVPYYRELFKRYDFSPETADLPSDFQRIPVLTKETIRRESGKLLAAGARSTDAFENATGGSTGVPLRFWQDTRYRSTAAALDAFVTGWWGVSSGDRTAAIWGADREFQELSFRERFYNWRHRRRSLNAFRMSEGDLLQFGRMLRAWKPRYLLGYASALDTFAQFAAERGFNDLRFMAIRSAAEVLRPIQRNRIETAFRSPVYDFYGSREVNNLAAECPEQHRLHLISTWRYLEIVDDDGRRVPDGQFGYVCVTDLSNYTMPFVRYRNEDIASLSSALCGCGRPSPVLEKLVGRSSDMIRTSRGDMIHGEFFTHLFYGRDDVRQFQIHQTSLSELVVRYVPVADSAHAFIAGISDVIRNRMGSETEVRLESCAEIPMSATGKYRFTISDFPFSIT